MGRFKTYLLFAKVSLKHLLVDGLSTMRQSYTSNSLIVQSFKMLSSISKFVQVETASKCYTFPTTASEFVFLQ